MKKLSDNALSKILMICLYVLCLTACGTPQIKDLEINISAKVSGQELQLNSLKYPNPNGEGYFSVRDFRFFLSNLVLFDGEQEYSVPDSYHLVNFDENGQARLILKNVPLSSVNKLQYGIGVDNTANKSLDAKGDLDPNSRMAWNWEVGYKFVSIEGNFYRDRDDERIIGPIVYHVGFDENYHESELAINSERKGIFLTVDLVKLFTSDRPIDMQKTSSIKFDRDDASNFSDGFKSFIAECAENCV